VGGIFEFHTLATANVDVPWTVKASARAVSRPFCYFEGSQRSVVGTQLLERLRTYSLLRCIKGGNLRTTDKEQLTNF
jgi:hypothetical protein